MTCIFLKDLLYINCIGIKNLYRAEYSIICRKHAGNETKHPRSPQAEKRTKKSGIILKHFKPKRKILALLIFFQFLNPEVIIEGAPNIYNNQAKKCTKI